MARCKMQGCKDEGIAFNDWCWDHCKDKEAYVQTLLAEIRKGTSFMGLNLAKVCLRDIDLSRADLSGVNMARADLSGAMLFDVVLKKAELLGANLSGADLTSSNLEDADLTRANLFGARLWHANLRGANLIEANLSSCDLWDSELYGIRMWRTNLRDIASLGKKNFGKPVNKYMAVYSINESGITSSEDAYRNLKKHFLDKGRYNDASWASFKEKSMEKKRLKKKKNPSYLPSLIMDLMCGYGEKPHRIIISSAAVITFYSLAYYLLNAIQLAQSVSYVPSMGDYLYYSIITFTTVGYGDFIPRSVPLFRLIAASQAFIGTFMIGLFIFTLARKYSAR